MKKIISIIGTRPDAIKMAPVIKEIQNTEGLQSIVCATAQHRQMLDQALNIFHITPNYDLDIMQPGQNLFDITIRGLKGIQDVLHAEKPDIVLAQGDTSTVLVAAMASFYLQIPFGHIEAGLRTFQKYSPFPEEKNRQIVSVLADFHFAPTQWAKNNLLEEKIAPQTIWVTGNTVIDALLLIAKKQDEGENYIWEEFFKKKWNLSFSFQNGQQKIILITGHRRENFGEKFQTICLAIKEIAQSRQDVLFIYPVHLNPNVQKPVNDILGDTKNILLIDPLEYEPFMFLLRHSYFVITDSGGIQEEAPSFGKPVLVTRDTTERPEGIKAGVAKLVGSQKNVIIKNIIELLENKIIYEKMAQTSNPYGDGMASRRIVKILKEQLTNKTKVC